MNFLQKLLSSPGAILKVVIGVCYMVLGLVFCVYHNEINVIDRRYNTVFGALFIAYGAFRLFRAVNDMRNE